LSGRLAAEPHAEALYPLDHLFHPRGPATVLFISFPITAVSAIAFGAISGLTWLSTVPPTSALSH